MLRYVSTVCVLSMTIFFFDEFQQKLNAFSGILLPPDKYILPDNINTIKLFGSDSRYLRKDDVHL